MNAVLLLHVPSVLCGASVCLLTCWLSSWWCASGGELAHTTLGMSPSWSWLIANCPRSAQSSKNHWEVFRDLRGGGEPATRLPDTQ